MRDRHLPLSPEEQEAQRCFLRSELYRELQAARGGKPLTTPESRSLENILTLLSKNYKAWTSYENDAPKLSEVLKTLENFKNSTEEVVKSINNTPWHQATIKELIESFDEDDILLRQEPIQYTTTKCSTNDKPETNKISIYEVEFETLKQNIITLHNAAKRALNKVRGFKTSKKDQSYADHKFSSNAQLIHQTWNILTKFTQVTTDTNNYKMLHTKIASTIIPIICEDLSGKDYSNIAQNRVRDYWQYIICLRHAQNEFERVSSDVIKNESDLFSQEVMDKIRSANMSLKKIVHRRFRSPLSMAFDTKTTKRKYVRRNTIKEEPETLKSQTIDTNMPQQHDTTDHNSANIWDKLNPLIDLPDFD